MKRIHKRQLNNKGFSLVEVLVAVAILAIVSLPIMKAFSTSAMVNRNARRQENANTAASAITEQFKSMTVERLVEKYGDTTQYGQGAKVKNEGEEGEGRYEAKAYTYDKATGKYVFYVTNRDKSYYEGVNEEKFYVEVELDPSLYENKYNIDGTLNTDNDNIANNINSYNMPEFSNINAKENYVVRDILYKWDNDAKGSFISQIDALNKANGTEDVFNPDKVIKSIELINSISIDESAASEQGEEGFIQAVYLNIKYEYTGLTPVEKTDINLGKNRFTIKRTKNEAGEDIYLVGNTETVYDGKTYGAMKDIYIFYMPYGAETNTLANDKITIKCNYETGTAGDGKSINYENIDTFIVEQNVTNISGVPIHLQKENVSLYINGDIKTSFETDGRTTDLPKEGNKKGPVSIYANISGWNSYYDGYRNNGITVNSPVGEKKYLYTINVKIWLDKGSKEQGEEPLVDMTSTKEN